MLPFYSIFKIIARYWCNRVLQGCQTLRGLSEYNFIKHIVTIRLSGTVYRYFSLSKIFKKQLCRLTQYIIE